ncbi:hypothetical protein ACTXT7_005630 [Hymenolepis weldensis]
MQHFKLNLCFRKHAFFYSARPAPTTAPWPGNNQAVESISTSTPSAQPASKPKWRPVKFNIPQKAS